MIFKRSTNSAAASRSAVASAQARHRFGASWRSALPQTPERHPHGDAPSSQTPPTLESGVGTPLGFCHRTPGRFALLLTLLLSTTLHAGWVAETSAELTTQGDWNADGTPDLLVLDRATGSLRVGLANGSAIDWQEPIPTGVEAATSIAFGQFTYMGQPKVGLAVTSPSLNRVQVIHPLIAEPQALVMQGLGPNALVTVAGGPAGGGNLIAASTLNAEPTPWHLSQIGGASVPGDALLERGNEIASDLYGFIARQQPAESFRLHQFSAGALIPQAWKTAPGVPTGADWTTGQFTATATKREYLFWQSGQPTLNVRTFDQVTAPPDFNAGTDFDLGQAIDEVAVLTGTTPPRLLVIFAGGTSAGVFDFDGVNAPTLFHALTPESGQTFRNALAANGGDFHLLSGALGCPTSDSARRWRRQPNGSYIADPASPMLALRPGSRRANLLLYVGEPFVDDNARLVSALSTRDWTTTANGIPGMIQATAEIFQSSAAGLGQPASVTLGASSYGPTHALPSQYADDVSISLYSAPVGLIGPELRLSPPPGRYAGTLNVVINSEGLSPAMQVLYRTDPTQPWQSYDAAAKPPIAITGTVQLQAYAASAGAAITPIVGGMYFIGTGSSSAVPFTLAATGITATSAMLNASVDPNGSATTALFDYGTTTALGTSTTGQSIGSGDSAVPVATEVTGLQAHTTYHFRAKATSAQGTNLGQRLTFTTGNRPPVFADATFNGTEDTPLTATLTATEPDGDALTFTLITAPPNGSFALQPSGSFTFTPQPDFHGTTSFTVKAADAFGGEDSATISLVIAPTNDLPTALAQTVQTHLNTPVTIALTGADLDGDVLIFEITTPPTHGTLTGTAPFLEYTPSTGYSGADNLAFRVKDGANIFSAPATAAINISNQPPLGNIRTWVGGTTGLWSDKNNWDPSFVPTSQNQVIINANDRPTLDIDALVYQLDLRGTITGTSAARKLGVRFLNFITGVPASGLQNGTFTAEDVTAPGFFALDQAILNLTGSMTNFAGLAMSNGSTLNTSGVVYAAQNDPISGTGGGNVINNSGSFQFLNIGNSAPTEIQNVDFNNTGQIDLVSGNVNFIGGTFTQTAGVVSINGQRSFNTANSTIFNSSNPIFFLGGWVVGNGTIGGLAGVVVGGARLSSSLHADLYFTNLSLSADSKLGINLGGVQPNQFGFIYSNGTPGNEILARNGRLEISFTNDFQHTVQAADEFLVFAHEGGGSPQYTTSGQFSNVLNGRVDTADGYGSFAVTAAGASLIRLSDFQPYPYIEVNTYTQYFEDGLDTENFGSQNVGTNNPKTFTIRNIGRVPLTGLALSISGANAADFTVTTPLGANSLGSFVSTSFVITFNPSATGPRTAQLHIASNDPHDSPFDVTLTGRGNAAPVLNLPASPFIVDATGPSGANVTFTVSATDADDASPPTAIATPASGSFFPVGDTLVNVSATDTNGATTTGSFTVRVRFPPPLLITLAPSPVTHVAAALRGTITPRGVLTSIHFEYGTTTSYGSTTAVQEIGAGFTTVDVVDVIYNLLPQTQYHGRIVATSALGTFIGNDMPFTTLPIAAAPIPVGDNYSTLANEALYLDSNGLMANDLPGSSALPFQIVGVGNEVNCFLVFYGSYIYFVPDQDFTGVASFTYTVANEQGGSATTTVTVQVDAPPVQPYIGGAATLTVVKNGVSPWLNFTVRPELNVADITVVVTSDNPALLPTSRIDFEGTGMARRLRLRPVCEQTGEAVITLTATSLDNLTASASFHVNVVAGVNPQIASIIGLGALPQESTEGYANSGAADVSANGGVVVGDSYGRPSGPFIWTPADGMTALGDDPNLFSQQVAAVSADGLVVAGIASSAEGQRGFLWTSLGGYLALPPDTQVHDVSADGSIAVGFRQYYTPSFDLITEPIRWTAAGGVTTLAIPAGFIDTRATGISSDGSTIIGYGMDASYNFHAVVWPVSGPPLLLPSLPAAYYTRAHDISADGSVIVGFSSNSTTGLNDAVRWVRDGMGGYLLNALFGGPGTLNYSTEAQSVSADGTKIVGTAFDSSGPFLWDGGNGMRPIATVLSIAGVDFSHDWNDLSGQCYISADGRFVVGYGHRQMSYTTEAYRIELPHTPAGPVISPIVNLSTNADTATPAIPFTLTDPDSNPECLVLTADSSNPTLVPPANIVFGGSGASRTVTVTPAAGQSGMALIVITVNDGFSTSMEDFTLTVGAPILNWRHQYFGTTTNTGDAADDADPDRDSRTNLEEFAFGMSPLAGLGSDLALNGSSVSRRGSPITLLQSGQPKAVFCRRADWQAAGLTYTVLFSANLTHKVPSNTEPTLIATDGEIEAVAIPYPATIEVGGQNVVPQFFQVRITKNP